MEQCDLHTIVRLDGCSACKGREECERAWSVDAEDIEAGYNPDMRCAIS